MSNDIEYVISGSASIKILADGQLVVRNSISREPLRLSEIDLAAMRAFGSPSLIPSAIAGAAEADRAKFQESVIRLAELSLIIPADQAAHGQGYLPAKGGFASPSIHHWMLRDFTRVSAYRNAIFAHAKDKVVLDLGCGSGILSIFAAQAGARKIYAIEESEISILAENMFKTNGCTDLVTLLSGNSLDIELPERVDLIIHEILGNDPFYENMLPYLDDARARFLKPGGRLLPNRIDVCCVGIAPEFVPPLMERARLEARELAGMYQIDFKPYLSLLELFGDIDEQGTLPRKGTDFRHAVFDQPILTEECGLLSVDLQAVDPAANIDGQRAELKINNDGHLGCLLIFFRAHLDEKQMLTTSPFAPRTHWGWIARDLPRVRAVRAGETLPLVCTLGEVAGRQRIRVRLDL